MRSWRALSRDQYKFDGRLIGTNGGHGEVEIAGGRRIKCMTPQAGMTTVAVSIRPESIRLLARGSVDALVDDNSFPGCIKAMTFLGSARRIEVTSDGIDLQVTAPATFAAPGDGEVVVTFAPESAIAAAGGLNLK